MNWTKTDGDSYECGEYRITPEYTDGHYVRAWTVLHRELEMFTEFRLRDAKVRAEKLMRMRRIIAS